MIKLKKLHTTTIKEYSTSSRDVEFSIFGLFDTTKVEWSYFLVSHIGNEMTPDIGGTVTSISIDKIKLFGKNFKTKELAMDFLTEFKEKWETGSNDIRQERRDKKINDILN